MLRIHGQNITYSIGDHLLLNIPSLKVYEYDRIGIVGKNGSGKTMLLKIINKELNPNDGGVELYGTIGHFHQLNDSAIRNSTLSGGEKTLQKLQDLFKSQYNCLLLDEPSNNLDWYQAEKLGERINSYKGAVILVSHNRSLLDSTCKTIWELEDGKLSVFKGNYQAYKNAKDLEKEQHQQKYDSFLKEKKRLNEAVENKAQQSKTMNRVPSRFGNKERRLYKAKAWSKRKKIERVSTVLSNRIERLEKVEKPFDWANIKMELKPDTAINKNYILIAKNLEKGIQERKLYKIPYLALKTGSKIAIVGPNGCGKTTLLNHLVSKKDEIEFAVNSQIGMFDQELSRMPENQTILEYVKEKSSKPEHLIRIILGRLHFYEQDVFKKISVLSGGERVKIALAKLIAGDYNLLIVDEPTNHLDLEALEALEGLVRDYIGTVLVVSHDKRFVENTADTILFHENETFTHFEGGLIEFLQNTKESQSVTDKEEELIRLKNKLSEVIGKLSIPNPKLNKQQLDQEYQELIVKIKKLQSE